MKKKVPDEITFKRAGSYLELKAYEPLAFWLLLGANYNLEILLIVELSRGIRRFSFNDKGDLVVTPGISKK